MVDDEEKAEECLKEVADGFENVAVKDVAALKKAAALKNAALWDLDE